MSQPKGSKVAGLGKLWASPRRRLPSTHGHSKRPAEQYGPVVVRERLLSEAVVNARPLLGPPAWWSLDVDTMTSQVACTAGSS